MKKMIRQTLMCSLTLAAVLALGACSKTDESSETPAPAATAPAPAPAATAPAAAPASTAMAPMSSSTAAMPASSSTAGK